MIKKYLETSPIFELSKQTRAPDVSANNVAFSGAPRRHPYDKDKFILISDPFSSHTIFYEFLQSDVEQVEELAELVTESGEALQTVRVWIRKNSLGLRYEPFLVEDTVRIMRDTTRPTPS